MNQKITLELTAFQLEANVPEIYKKQWQQPSYWKHAYALAGMEDKLLMRITNIEILMNSGLAWLISRTALQVP